MADTNKTDEVTINRARLGSITVFEVMEEELEIIERGSPGSTFLNFSIALISIGISFLITLFTATIPDTRVFIVFVIVTILSLISGIFLFVVWWRTKGESKAIFHKIRKRISPLAIRESIQEREE